MMNESSSLVCRLRRHARLLLCAPFVLLGLLGAAVQSRAVEPTYAISGSVGREGAGAHVDLNLSGAFVSSTTADMEGNYRFSGLANGYYAVSASKFSYAFSPRQRMVTVSSGDVTDVNFLAARALWAISGSVGSDGAGAEVLLTGSLSRGGGVADGIGNFRFDNLPDGSYTLTPRKSGYVFRPESIAVTVSLGDLRDVNFTAFQMNYAISGNAGATGAEVVATGVVSTTTTSDAAGNYRLDALPNGIYTVSANHPLYRFRPDNVQVTIAGADVVRVNFTKQNAIYAIRGSVGAAGAGAVVTMSGATTGSTTADANGNYLLGVGLARGDITVNPRKAGFVFAPPDRTVTITGADVAGVNFTATPLTYAIRGSVGAAGAGAVVALSGAASRNATADAGGNYEFAGLSAGGYTVSPSKAGYGFDPPSRPVTIAGANVTGVNFTATATPAFQAFSISGLVSLRGLLGASTEVTLSWAGGTRVESADYLGQYSFGNLSDGSYTVRPAREGYRFEPESAPVTISGANVRLVNFTAVQALSISGSVGALGAGAELRLKSSDAGWIRTTTADSGGRYRFADLSSGEYSVFPSKPGYQFNPTLALPRITAADVRVDFEATQLNYSIRGSVGAAGAGAVVALSGAASRNATADASGNYEFAGLAAGDYTVSPSKAGYGFDPPSRAVTIARANVTGVNFTATPLTYTIRGSVGTVGLAAEVTLSEEGGARGTQTKSVNNSGQFSFENLSNGSYTVRPARIGYRFQPESALVAIAGADVAEVNFTPVVERYAISGRVGAAGIDVIATGRASKTVVSDAAGNYSLKGLPNGEYTVRARGSGYRVDPEHVIVTIAGADVSEVDFRTTPIRYAISGRVNIAPPVHVYLSGGANRMVSVNEEGDFRFEDLSNGTYTVRPAKDGFRFRPESMPVTISGADVARLNFTASTITYSISGSVGALGSGAEVVLTHQHLRRTTTADREGRFRFENLSNGTYTVSPAKDGHRFQPESMPVTISGADVARLNFTASMIMYSISGSLGSLGLGAEVVLSGQDLRRTKKADREGRYRFTELPSGAYRVAATKPGYTISPDSQSVQVVSTDKNGVDFTTVSRLYSISGYVRPSSWSTPTLILSGAVSRTMRATGQGDSFRFTDLPNGTYTVSVREYPGYTFYPERFRVTISGSNVDDLMFRKERVRNSISGSVGSAGAGAEVMIEGQVSKTTTADASGRYRFTEVPTGPFTIRVRKPDYEFTPEAHQGDLAGTDLNGLNFAARRVRFSIGGRVTFKTGPGAGVRVTLSGKAGPVTVLTDRNGAYQFGDLKEGSYTVSVYYGGAGTPPATKPVSLPTRGISSFDFAF